MCVCFACQWLDSDPYWQAFVEKHFFYAQYQPGVEDPESPVSSNDSSIDDSGSESNRGRIKGQV